MAIFKIPVVEALALPSARCPGMPEDAPLYTVGEVIGMGIESMGEDWFTPGLEESIRAHGQDTPVAIVDGELADGHHRVELAARLELGYVLATDGADGEWVVWLVPGREEADV